MTTPVSHKARVVGNSTTQRHTTATLSALRLRSSAADCVEVYPLFYCCGRGVPPDLRSGRALRTPHDYPLYQVPLSSHIGAICELERQIYIRIFVAQITFEQVRRLSYAWYALTDPRFRKRNA